MKTILKKTLLAALPFAGLLLINSPASAHDDWQHERFHDQLGNLHEQEHENLGALHEEFHEHPYSRSEHRRFHRWLNREHHDYHGRDRDWDRRYDGNYYRGQYGVQQPYGYERYYGASGWPWWR